MQVKDVMRRGAGVVHPTATLEEAAQEMQLHNMGALPVCEGQRLVGMITDRDITVRATAVGLDPITNKVQDIMSPDVAYCYEDQDAREAARMMQDQQIRRVVVVNRDQRLVGIVSLDDLAAESGDEQLSGQVLDAVTQRAREAPGG